MRATATTAVLLLTVNLTPIAALARRVLVEDGTAGLDLQGAAAFLALLPVVTVAVFAMAQWAGWRN